MRGPLGRRVTSSIRTSGRLWLRTDGSRWEIRRKNSAPQPVKRGSQARMRCVIFGWTPHRGSSRKTLQRVGGERKSASSSSRRGPGRVVLGNKFAIEESHGPLGEGKFRRRKEIWLARWGPLNKQNGLDHRWFFQTKHVEQKLTTLE